MRRSGLLSGGLSAGIMAFAACGASAQDGGLRLIFGIENRIEVERNSSLSVPAAGTTVSNVTALSFGLISETALDRLEFNASGAVIVEDSDRTDGSEVDFGRSVLSFGYSREVPAAVLDLSARFRTDDADEFADDLSLEDTVGTRTDYGATARLEVGRTSPIGFAVGVEYDATDFQDTVDPDLEDSRELRAEAQAIFHFSEVATGRLGLRYRHREEDDLAETDTEAVTAFVGLDYAISERLDFEFELGYDDIETEEFGVIERIRGPEARIVLTYGLPTGTATVSLRVANDVDEGRRETFEIGRTIDRPAMTFAARLGVTHSDETGTDMIGGLEWTRTLPDGSIGATLARTVGFDADDSESVIRSVFSLSWSHQVNEVSGLSVDLMHEVSDAASERIEQTTFGAAYSHQLTADWDLNGGVDYRVRDDGDGHSESPGIFVALRRDFEIRP
jgi:hypothetical protein